jgi:hypothetical protein
MQKATRADLTAWVGMHVRSAGIALAEYPSIVSQMFGRDASDEVYIKKLEEMAIRLEDAARMIRRDVARSEGLDASATEGE